MNTEKHQKQEAEYRLIAEYAGDKDFVHDYRNPALGWGWIMPIVTKITSDGFSFTMTTYKTAFGCRVGHLAKTFSKTSLLDAVVTSVIGFIEWHNQNKI